MDFPWLDKDSIKIIETTFILAFCSTSISSVIGVLAGIWLQAAKFIGKPLVIRINRTFMGMPPVVMGLLTYLLLKRKGLLGSLNLLFTMPAMIIVQVLIITPIICGIVYQSADRNAVAIRQFGVSMGANKSQIRKLLISEMGNEIYFAIITGFGRAISEVGAVMIVGGNVKNKTRTMTTAITLLRNMGDYSQAIQLGFVLLVCAFMIQSFSDHLRRKERIDENF